MIFYLLAGLAAGFSTALLVGIELELLYTILIAVGAGVFFLIGIICSICGHKKRKYLRQQAITLQKQDLILHSGKTYKVSPQSTLRAGKYVLLAVDESNMLFTLRINGLVKTYNHNTQIVLANNDTISPRSHNVILRRAQ